MSKNAIHCTFIFYVYIRNIVCESILKIYKKYKTDYMYYKRGFKSPW